MQVIAEQASESLASDRYDQLDERLLTTRVQSLDLALTSACNIRCVYCPTGWNKTIDRDLSPGILAEIKAFAKAQGITTISYGHVGETTFFEGWEEIADYFSNEGLSQTILSNFSKQFSDREIETFSKFQSIMVSIDTHRTDIQPLIRKKVDVRTMVYNMSRIAARAVTDGREPPPFTWVCTLTDKVADHLEEFVAFAAANRVRTINFHPLSKFTNIEPTVRDILDLDTPDMMHAIQQINRALTLCQRLGIQVIFAGIEAFNAKVKVALGMSSAEQEGLETIHLESMYHGQKFYGIRMPEELTTRLCLAPWRNVFINSLHSSADVYPCCQGRISFGELTDGNSIEGLINSQAARDLRVELLTGRLNDTCRACPSAPPARPGQQQQMVAQYLGVDMEALGAGVGQG